MCMVKASDPKGYKRFVLSKYEGNIGEVLEQEEKLCDV